ncbi:toxin-antitoxin system, toxin component, HicA family protein [Pediococcus ethanolidurans]|nr:toxin-antitoxin system, toxin component, HicA family protein [Pediococcus ethanolidurans]
MQVSQTFQKKGWRLKRHGDKHDIWTNGHVNEPIPRHPEINERLARHLIQKNHLK